MTSIRFMRTDDVDGRPEAAGDELRGYVCKGKASVDQPIDPLPFASLTLERVVGHETAASEPLLLAGFESRQAQSRHGRYTV